MAAEWSGGTRGKGSARPAGVIGYRNKVGSGWTGTGNLPNRFNAALGQASEQKTCWSCGTVFVYCTCPTPASLPPLGAVRLPLKPPLRGNVMGIGLAQYRSCRHDNGTPVMLGLDERDVDGFRVCGAALPSGSGNGFVAALVVRRRDNHGRGRREVLRQTALGGGLVWDAQADALAGVMSSGVAVAQALAAADTFRIRRLT